MPERLSRARRRFIEQIGVVFEELHLPRMAGRILGALLIGPPDGLTAAELGERLDASKGSISTMARLLAHYRLIERVPSPGERSDRLAVRQGAWRQMLEDRFTVVREIADLADEGLGLLPEDGDPALLNEVRDLYGFLERELPRLFDRWEQQRHDKEVER